MSAHIITAEHCRTLQEFITDSHWQFAIINADSKLVMKRHYEIGNNRLEASYWIHSHNFRLSIVKEGNTDFDNTIYHDQWLDQWGNPNDQSDVYFAVHRLHRGVL